MPPPSGNSTSEAHEDDNSNLNRSLGNAAPRHPSAVVAHEGPFVSWSIGSTELSQVVVCTLAAAQRREK
jgi:hypothetical protein